MTDPWLVVRYHRDAFGLMTVQTLLRRRGPEGIEIELLGVSRKVMVDAEGCTPPLPIRELGVGRVPMGPLPGHRSPSNSAWRMGTGLGRGST